MMSFKMADGISRTRAWLRVLLNLSMDYTKLRLRQTHCRNDIIFNYRLCAQYHHKTHKARWHRNPLRNTDPAAPLDSPTKVNKVENCDAFLSAWTNCETFVLAVVATPWPSLYSYCHFWYCSILLDSRCVQCLSHFSFKDRPARVTVFLPASVTAVVKSNNGTRWLQ